MPVVFRVKLGKTGHSYRITLPKPVTDGFQWEEGDEFELVVTEQEITVRRVGHVPVLRRQKREASAQENPD